jgi:hypothetical protein
VLLTKNRLVAKCRERLAVSKRRSILFLIERTILEKLNEVDGKEQYHDEI